ncbi:MAG: hypothetical protein QMD36_05705 [Candidatus Aenigmarchaeota archaeon]|nr:hypothetical protein [Candidatus Aenigmarchaeota archaeon]
MKKIWSFSRKIILFTLVVYFLSTMSYIIHESVHVLQANGIVSEVCFLGYGKYYESGTMHAKYGWVKSYNFPEGDLEKDAYLIELIFTISFGIILGIFLSYEIFCVKDSPY